MTHWTHFCLFAQLLRQQVSSGGFLGCGKHTTTLNCSNLRLRQLPPAKLTGWYLDFCQQFKILRLGPGHARQPAGRGRPPAVSLAWCFMTCIAVFAHLTFKLQELCASGPESISLRRDSQLQRQTCHVSFQAMPAWSGFAVTMTSFQTGSGVFSFQLLAFSHFPRSKRSSRTRLHAKYANCIQPRAVEALRRLPFSCPSLAPSYPEAGSAQRPHKIHICCCARMASVFSKEEIVLYISHMVHRLSPHVDFLHSLIH